MAYKVIKFKKVSYEQFKTDCLSNPLFKNLTDDEIQEAYDKIKLPTRSTSGSAGYDFVTPFEISVSRNPVVFPTGIRCVMDKSIVLLLMPRSGLGFKYGMGLTNTIGVIDSDYSHSANEGHIMAKVQSDKAFLLNAGDRFMQGIFVNYYTTFKDNTKRARNGGFGSTGK